MATTRIMPLHVGKGRTESRAISDIIDYVANPKKTDDGRLITGYACDSRTVDAEFLLAKRQYIAATGRVRGADDVIAYHVRQSFRPGEITPEEANRLGVEFAKRFTKGNHAFVVCTHIDKSHIHNHIIWSSVSLEYDRKFRNFWGSTKAVRQLSDTICIENGLSIVENPKPHGKSYNKWLGDQAKPSHRELLRVAIDNALSQSPADFEELLRLLQESGCEVSKRGKSYRLKLPGWEKAARMDSLGEGYGLEDLQAVLSGKKAHTPRKKTVTQAEPPKVNLLVDIQAKLQAGKGAGYARWAKVFNLKQMAQTMNYLSENNLLEYAVLEEKAAAATAHHNELSAQIKAAEKRMAEIAVLRTHIVNYAKTREVYEEKWITRTTKTDFTIYNSIAVQVLEGFRYHEDALPQEVVDMIREQNGVEDERYLYRNTADDGNVLVDYGFDGLTCTNTYEYENGVSKSFGRYTMRTAPDAENLFYGNVFGASEHFWADMMIYEGETDPDILTQKMATGEYVIIGTQLDRLSGGPEETPLTEQLQIGDSISFYRDGELVKTCTILAKACTVGTEDETPSTITAIMNIGGDAPFVYLPDTLFKQIYATPTLLSYGFNMDDSLQPQMEEFLSSYVEKNPSVTYTSTKLLKEQLNSIGSMILVVGSLIGCIMALAGLINFTNMIITNIITRRHEFATMQSIGMTNRQLQRLMVYEGVYYAAGADIIGGVVALLLAVTVLKNVLNSPSMWFFTLNITLVPVLVIGVLYLLLAAVIPLIVLHFFNKGTVVERLRTSE